MASANEQSRQRMTCIRPCFRRFFGSRRKGGVLLLRTEEGWGRSVGDFVSALSSI